VVRKVVRAHQARLDGTGVPDGLVGTDIPREARIVSVADAFDAMMSRRPYRKGLSYEAALTELRRVADSQFDPEVVDALLEVVAGGSIDLDDRGNGVKEAKKLLSQYSCKS
jgi:HD-GYP domain-containing protein (c-di-GMP phosphodiesterase class II)